MFTRTIKGHPVFDISAVIYPSPMNGSRLGGGGRWSNGVAYSAVTSRYVTCPYKVATADFRLEKTNKAKSADGKSEWA